MSVGTYGRGINGRTLGNGQRWWSTCEGCHWPEDRKGTQCVTLGRACSNFAPSSGLPSTSASSGLDLIKLQLKAPSKLFALDKIKKTKKLSHSMLELNCCCDVDGLWSGEQRNQAQQKTIQMIWVVSLAVPARLELLLSFVGLLRVKAEWKVVGGFSFILDSLQMLTGSPVYKQYSQQLHVKILSSQLFRHQTRFIVVRWNSKAHFWTFFNLLESRIHWTFCLTIQFQRIIKSEI